MWIIGIVERNDQCSHTMKGDRNEKISYQTVQPDLVGKSSHDGRIRRSIRRTDEQLGDGLDMTAFLI